MQQPLQEETARLEKIAESAFKVMRFRFDRNKIGSKSWHQYLLLSKDRKKLLTITLMNFLDNSIYWLQKNKENDRKIKIITASIDNNCLLVVSDNGPGFEDLVEIVTLPFFTRKPGGMGLGLYIADRIARMNGGQVKILNGDELPGLLQGQILR